MSIFDTARQRLAQAIAPRATNSYPASSAVRDYWRNHGRGGWQAAEWSQLLMSEPDKYTGYMYGAIDRRAKKAAMLAKHNLRTRTNDKIAAAAKERGETITHPYLQIINDSTDFSNWAFWYEIQTYLDLKGVYYLMAVRNRNQTSVGKVQDFKLINPYDMTVVRDGKMQVIAYVEARDGLQREIEPHMIIPIRTLNPFSRIDPFSMSDAAKDAQFTLKESHDQIRNTVRRNKKFPGVLMLGDGEVSLDDEQVTNMKARLLGNRKADEPMLTEGKGALDWNDMQLDIRKSAPKDTDEISLKALIAATGVSKTKFGIEESGTTRDTSQTQDDQFTTDHAMPQVQLIADALSLDYQRNYPEEYKRHGYELEVDNPTGRDHDAEIKDIKARGDTYKLYGELVDAGYEPKKAAQYAAGDIDLAELGQPTLEPRKTRTEPSQDDAGEDTPDETDKADNAHTAAHTCHETHDLPVIRNQLDDASASELERQTATLKAAVVSVQQRLVAEVLNKVERNAYEANEDIVPPKEQQNAINELALVIASYYLTVMPLFAAAVMARRLKELALIGVFNMDSGVRQYIKRTSDKAAESHISTILGDIRITAQREYDTFVDEYIDRVSTEAGEEAGKARTRDEILQEARERANSGEGRRQIANAIRKKYADEISKYRAENIARTEASRARNRAQFEADRQFIQQNGLEARAFKKWITRSGNPCPICRYFASLPPRPFGEPFAKLGETISVPFDKDIDGREGVQIIKVTYETLECGNAHPLCDCSEQLIIE